MNTYKCPECGSTEVGSQLYVSPDPSSYDNIDNPWSHVLQQILCGKCNNYIPSHLGERWDDITYLQAKKEWVAKYKTTK